VHCVLGKFAPNVAMATMEVFFPSFVCIDNQMMKSENRKQIHLCFVKILIIAQALRGLLGKRNVLNKC